MPRKVIALFLLLACMLLPAGCSQNEEQTSKANNTTVETVAVPDEFPALTGKVKTIIGNEVTLYQMAAPEDNQADTLKGSETSASSNISTAPADSIAPSNEENIQSAAAEAMPVMQQETSLPASAGEKETVTFLIPAGAPIVGLSTGTDGAPLLSLSDISTGSMINIWKSGDTIKLVQVMTEQAGQNRKTDSEDEQQMPGMPPMGGGAPPGMGGGSGLTQSLRGGR